MTGLVNDQLKVISIEKTFALHKSAQEKTFFPGIFLKESSWLALFNHFKIANFEKLWFFTLDDTLKGDDHFRIISILTLHALKLIHGWER